LVDARILVIAKVKKVPATFPVKEKEIIDIFDEIKREVEIEFLMLIKHFNILSILSLGDCNQPILCFRQ